MEKLTGKCKEDFLAHYWSSKIKPTGVCTKEDLESFFDSVYEIYQNALIIDFFDSVVIYVNVIRYTTKWVGIAENTLWESFYNRPDAINHAIREANEIYNSKQ